MKEHGYKIIDLNLTYSDAEKATPASIAIPAGLEPDTVCHTKLPPILKSAPDPKYPTGAPKLRGSVILMVLISKDGNVKDSQILQSLHGAYDLEAQLAVKDWKYAPAQCDGIPEETKASVEVRFNRK
jgi:TonB family protein